MSALEGESAAAPATERAGEEPTDRSLPEFEVLDAQPVERAASPTLRFEVRATDRSELPVYMIALSVLITIEPAKRSYDGPTRERLIELFGEPERWATTTTSFRWTQADVFVPGFAETTTFSIPVACTYDLEVAASKYFHGVEDGEAPLRFHFSGTVFYEAENGSMQQLRIPWDRSVRYSMPVAAWDEMIAAHYPYRAWIPVHTETLARLARRKATLGLPTFDATAAKLLDEEGD